MTRVAAFTAALGVALALGASAPAKMEGRLFALHGAQGGQYVVELDPEALTMLPQRRLRIAPATTGYPWSHDPGRRFLAAAVGQRLKIVDLAGLRVVRTARLGVHAQPAGVIWLRPDRIVVLLRAATDFDVVVFDARRLRVVSRSRVAGGTVVDSELMRDGVALLLAPPYTIGPARLLFVDAAGASRTVALDRIRAGFDRDPNDQAVYTHTSPGLAFDAARDCLYVVAPGGVVAEVRRDDVRYRALHGVYAKVGSGDSRQAFVVGDRLVVTGTVEEMLQGGSEPVGTSRGIGIQLVNLSTWETTRVADSVSSVVLWRDALVATGGIWHSQTGHRGVGIALYALDGRERLRALDGKRVWVAAVYRDRAYAYLVEEERMAVVDLATGTVTRPATKALPLLLLEHASPVW